MNGKYKPEDLQIVITTSSGSSIVFNSAEDAMIGEPQVEAFEIAGLASKTITIARLYPKEVDMGRYQAELPGGGPRKRWGGLK